MKKSLIILIVLNLFACKSVKNSDALIDESKVDKVSLISVIANPKKYHNKTIAVEGYFTMETEGQAIFISKDAYQTMIFKNAVYLYLDYNSLKKMNINEPYKGYVKIEGVFNKNLKGSYNFYSGGIEKITTISRLYKRGSSSEEFNMD